MTLAVKNKSSSHFTESWKPEPINTKPKKEGEILWAGDSHGEIIGIDLNEFVLNISEQKQTNVYIR